MALLKCFRLALFINYKRLASKTLPRPNGVKFSLKSFRLYFMDACLCRHDSYQFIFGGLRFSLYSNLTHPTSDAKILMHFHFVGWVSAA